MAQSGSYNFSVTRDDLIKDAHLYIGAIAEGETPSVNQVTEAARILNMIVKLREADGMPAWALRRGTILPFTDSSSINTNSHVVTTYRTTTLSAAALSAASSVVVTSATGISDGDVIGIALSDNTMQWTLVSGAPVGTTVTINTPLTAAASSGARVYIYTSSTDRIQKPLRIIDANIYQQSNSTSWNIQIDSQSEYFNLSSRTSTGIPNRLFYSIEGSSLTALETNGQIYIYPRFNSGDYVIEFTYHRPFQDFDGASDEPDFPQAFYLPLMLELASLLGPKFGVPKEERAALKEEAAYYRNEALTTVYPEGSLFIGREDR